MKGRMKEEERMFTIVFGGANCHLETVIWVSFGSKCADCYLCLAKTGIDVQRWWW